MPSNQPEFIIPNEWTTSWDRYIGNGDTLDSAVQNLMRAAQPHNDAEEAAAPEPVLPPIATTTPQIRRQDVLVNCSQIREMMGNENIWSRIPAPVQERLRNTTLRAVGQIFRMSRDDANTINAVLAMSRNRLNRRLMNLYLVTIRWRR